MDLTPAQRERFWTKVDRSGGLDACWPWTAAVLAGDGRRGGGYGLYGVRRPRGRSQVLRAHRVAYFLAVGPIGEGLQVLHACDNPPCCNPLHLFQGTPKDNMQDKQRKGRGRGACGFGPLNCNARR